MAESLAERVVDRIDVARSVGEYWATRPGAARITAAQITTAIVAHPSRRAKPADAATTGAIAVPFSSGGNAMVGYLDPVSGGVECTEIVPVGRGRFVHGPDNAIFGRWNALVAAHRSGHCEAFAAHGGEIIPGRLADHVHRLREGLLHGRNYPVQVDLDISMACPSACSFCFSAAYRAKRNHGRMMSAALIRRLIDQASDIGVRVIRFDGGGDPLTHPGLPAAIERCAQRDIATAVLTAGDLLSQCQSDAFVAAGTYVRVSLNAASDHIRNLLHGRPGDRFGVERVFRAVGRLAEHRARRWGRDARVRMPIGATSMVHPANADETVAIARRAKEAGFDHLSFRVILGAGHRVVFSEPARRRLRDAFSEIEREVCDESFLVFAPTRELTDQGYLPSRYFDRCRASVHRALVEVGPEPGRAAIVPCGRYRGQGFAGGTKPVVFGYLDEQSDIKVSWMNPRMRALLASFPEACGDCIDRSANVFLNRIEDNLRRDPEAQFFTLCSERAPGESSDA